ncbi:MAG: winged helix-turn-helix domain-containing protein [Kofleriaceae bacterium]|nr:winged helix-turn-helix domain-containing protein [Kofleriaceae bacterium]
MSTLAMVEQIMRQTKIAMSVRDIVELAGESLPTRSKTPETVVARDLSVNIKKLGEESRFVRTAPGRYSLREFVTSGIIAMTSEVATVNSAAVNSAAANSVTTNSATVTAIASDTTPVLESALRDGPSGVISSPASGSDSARHVLWTR